MVKGVRVVKEVKVICVSHRELKESEVVKGVRAICFYACRLKSYILDFIYILSIIPKSFLYEKNVQW